MGLLPLPPGRAASSHAPHGGVIVAPVFRDPSVVASLAFASRPLASVDHVDIYAKTRTAALETGQPRPTTPESHVDSAGRATKFWHGQGYAPGTSLHPSANADVTTLLGPYVAEKLAREAGVFSQTDLILHKALAKTKKTKETDGGAPASSSDSPPPPRSVSPMLSMAALAARSQGSGPPPRSAGVRPTGLGTGAGLDMGGSTWSSSGGGGGGGGDLPLGARSAASSTLTELLVSLGPAGLAAAAAADALPVPHGVGGGGVDTLHPRVHASLGHLSEAVLASQVTPFSPAQRAFALGSVHAVRPLPFKLSPVQPRKPVSLRKRNMFADMFAGKL
jgi:hypothetical protein